MSPRRRIEPGIDDGPVVTPVVRPTWRERLRGAWRLIGLSVAASLLVVAAIVLSGLMLQSHISDDRTNARDADVLGYVGQFMTRYTTLDPFHANDYADGILADATGEFAKEFKDKQNAILIQVARAEPTKGSVVEAGIEKWRDDDSVSVLVATKIATTAGDPKKPVESGNRWVVTAVQEGQQWKISQLTQVI
ncbi:MAG: mammalian cell entry protein [Candidatus Sericytochromatia bacterium]